jgi:uroporphyrinogen III methyltransferase / synthase
VKNFIALLGNVGAGVPPVLGEVKLASIGPVTSATLRELGLSVDIEAREYTIPGLVRAIARSSKS